MSALTHIARASAVVFGFLAAACFALPFLNALARTYEGGATLLVDFLFGGVLAFASGIHYVCYRYTRTERGGPGIRAFIWCVVAVPDLSLIAIAIRIIWLIYHPADGSGTATTA
jgi:hypothetical protein